MPLLFSFFLLGTADFRLVRSSVSAIYSLLFNHSTELSSFNLNSLDLLRYHHPFSFDYPRPAIKRRYRTRFPLCSLFHFHFLSLTHRDTLALSTSIRSFFYRIPSGSERCIKNPSNGVASTQKETFHRIVYSIPVRRTLDPGPSHRTAHRTDHV
jgi:hypothetical protein